MSDRLEEFKRLCAKEDALGAKYPEILQYEKADGTKYTIGMGLAEGWYPLIDKLCAGIMALSKEQGFPPPQALQIKEKFGTLRFYIGPATQEVHDLVNKICAESATTCERCGAPGELRGEGWAKTLCDKCDKGE